MSVDAKDLESDYVSVINTSKGDCKINCNQKISYKISGTGNIYLTGHPPLVEKIEESSSEN